MPSNKIKILYEYQLYKGTHFSWNEVWSQRSLKVIYGSLYAFFLAYAFMIWFWWKFKLILTLWSREFFIKWGIAKIAKAEKRNIIFFFSLHPQFIHTFSFSLNLDTTFLFWHLVFSILNFKKVRSRGKLNSKENNGWREKRELQSCRPEKKKNMENNAFNAS